MTDAVTKQTIIHSVYTNFYDIVSAIEPANIFAERIFPSMPDIELNALNSYPIILLESPLIDLKQFSMGKNLTEGTINFYVYTTNAKLRDQLIDKINYAIETNKGVFATKNIRQVEIDKISTDEVARGKIKVHFCTIPIKFKFYSDKTFAF
jgi:hypothetical protein